MKVVLLDTERPTCAQLDKIGKEMEALNIHEDFRDQVRSETVPSHPQEIYFEIKEKEEHEPVKTGHSWQEVQKRIPRYAR